MKESKKSLPKTSSCDDIHLQESAQTLKALGDISRLRILDLLKNGERYVCDIMEVLKLRQSIASRHLAYLNNAHRVLGTCTTNEDKLNVTG